jgi:hypothetical protein
VPVDLYAGAESAKDANAGAGVEAAVEVAVGMDGIVVIGLANVDADRLLVFVVRRTKRDNLVLVSNQPIIR